MQAKINIDSIVKNLDGHINQQLAHLDSLTQLKVLAHQDSLQIKNKLDSAALAALTNSLEHNIIAEPHVATYNQIEIEKVTTPYNFKFWMLLLAIAIPAIFRFINPSYFKNIFVAYRNPNLSARQLKEQLSQNSMASLAMDFFFCFVMGLFIYSAIQHHITKELPTLLQKDVVLLLTIVVGIGIIYGIKKFFLKILGILFKSDEAFELFTFNIFLLNRVLAFLLLPCTALLLLGPPTWHQPILLISLLIISFFFIQRYVRSAATFNYLLKYSRFHFFLYLCASEVMPIFILVKALSDFLKL